MTDCRGQDSSLPLSLPASLSLFLPSFLPINNSWVPVEPGLDQGSELENESNPALASRTQKFRTMTLVSHIEISTGAIRKSPWCWERLRAEGEEGIRWWDGWMASLMQWTRTWGKLWEMVSDREDWHLRFLGLQKVGQNWVTEQLFSKSIFTKTCCTTVKSKRIPRGIILIPRIPSVELSDVYNQPTLYIL